MPPAPMEQPEETAITSFAHASRGNQYPIVLVVGFLGWGRDEALGRVKYWGGLQADIQQELRHQGHQVFTASLGPVSSNWDRACELFAQIKGGRVDYGRNHSKRFNHQRYGRLYPGFYPEWGTKDASGQTRKIHLIGHSMGGQTVRMLAQLLATGSQNAPVEEDCHKKEFCACNLCDDNGCSLLFQGDHEDWIHSITTLSSPHRGSFVSDLFVVTPFRGETTKLCFWLLVGLLGLPGTIVTKAFDFKLDHWNLGTRQRQESLRQYVQRVLHSGALRPGVKDFSHWSESTLGTQEENAWVHTLPSIFYYSYATKCTYQSKNLRGKNVHKPHLLTTLPVMYATCHFLGSRYGPDNGFSEDWQGNDGVVSTTAMISDGKGQVVHFEGVSHLGKWNHIGTLVNHDHMSLIGFAPYSNVQPLYDAHVALLASLPADPLVGSNENQPASETVVVAPEPVTQELQAAVASCVNSAKNKKLLVRSRLVRSFESLRQRLLQQAKRLNKYVDSHVASTKVSLSVLYSVVFVQVAFNLVGAGQAEVQWLSSVVNSSSLPTVFISLTATTALYSVRSRSLRFSNEISQFL